MTAMDLERSLTLSRRQLLELLSAVEAAAEAAVILGWRPGAGRAPLAWQLMHVAATDDRHLNVRMRGGEPADAEFVRRFAGGSTPDDDVPSARQIREYLEQ